MSRPYRGPATVALAAALALGACHHAEANPLRATGTIEVRETDVSPLVPARVVRVLVDEGQAVRSGDPLVALTQSTTQADIAGGEARLRAAEAALREALAGA
ncbi:MAG: biotin/lipoyl-binding protein, partial [Gemmatimonadales bacterium]